jgi:hypothetical protein
VTYYHWWPDKNRSHWIQYDFTAPAEISTSKIYWFDDGPFGGCRIPKSWKLLYKTENNDWREVEPEGDYSITKDELNTIHFKKVKTSAVKIEVQLPEEFAAGIYEWIVE